MKSNKNLSIILAVVFVIQLLVPAGCLCYEKHKQSEVDKLGKEYKIVLDYVTYDDGSVYFDADAIKEVTDYLYEEDANYVVFNEDKYGLATCSSSTKKPDTPYYVSMTRLNVMDNNDTLTEYKSKAVSEVEFAGDWYLLYEREVIEDVTDKNLSNHAYAIVKVFDNRAKVTNIIVKGVPIDEYIKTAEAAADDIYEAYDDYNNNYEDGDYEVA